MQANCGHEVDIGETVLVREGHESCDAVDGYRAAVNYYSYCAACAERAKGWDTYLADEAAEDWWFREGYLQWRERIAREQG